MSMDGFKNIRQVNSPAGNANSPMTGFNSQSRQSVVVGRNSSAFGLEPTKLDFKTSKVESKFTNISMIQSQVVNNNPGYSNTTSNAFYTSGVGSGSSLGGPSNASSRVAIDPMKESTMNYVRNVYRGLGNLPQDRIKTISQNFMRLYGTDRQITENGLKNIQRQAHLHFPLEQSSETISGLLQVLDSNQDKRVTQQDIISAARRYLSFEKKQIIYTPMVQERLAVARRLFKQFDVERKGYLTEKQVPNLLSETYKCLGKTFAATPQDIKSWMKLTDSDNNGRVTLPEYEQSIIRALKKQGVRIYDQ